MPRYIALIEVELDEPTIAGAMEVAREIATKICNDAFTTDIARATGLQTTGEERELYEVDRSFSIVNEDLPEGCFIHDGYCTIENCQNPEHDEGF